MIVIPILRINDKMMDESDKLEGQERLKDISWIIDEEVISDLTVDLNTYESIKVIHSQKPKTF